MRARFGIGSVEDLAVHTHACTRPYTPHTHARARTHTQHPPTHTHTPTHKFTQGIAPLQLAEKLAVDAGVVVMCDKTLQTVFLDNGVHEIDADTELRVCVYDVCVQTYVYMVSIQIDNA